MKSSRCVLCASRLQVNSEAWRVSTTQPATTDMPLLWQDALRTLTGSRTRLLFRNVSAQCRHCSTLAKRLHRHSLTSTHTLTQTEQTNRQQVLVGAGGQPPCVAAPA